MGWVFLVLSILLWAKCRIIQGENKRLAQLVAAREPSTSTSITVDGVGLPVRCPNCKRPHGQ